MAPTRARRHHEGVIFLCILAIFPAASPLRVCEQNFYNNPRWDLAQYSLSVARADVAEFKVGQRVYYAGGRTSQTAVTGVIDVLADPIAGSGSFQALPQRLTTARYNARAVANVTSGVGTVLIAGGTAETAGSSYASSAVDILSVSSSGEVNVTAAALSSNRSLVLAANAGSYMLFAGGISGSPGSYVAHDTVDVYDMATNTWAVSASPVWPSRYNGVAVAIDAEHVLFAGGGNLEGVHRECSIFRYNGVNGTWGQYQIEQGNNGLQVGRFAPAAVTIGGKILIAGGALTSGTTWSRRVDVFDPSRPEVDPFRWTSSEVLSVQHRNIAGAVIGGLAVFGSAEGVDIFDSATGAWLASQGPQMSLTSTWRAVGVGTTQVLFAGGGFSEGRVAVYDVDGCEACPANSVAPAGSTRATNCSCSAGYTGENGGACTCCAIAEYKSGVGPGACKACPAGSAGALNGLSPTPRCTGDANLCCRGDLGETLKTLPVAEGNLAELEERCADDSEAATGPGSGNPALGGAPQGGAPWAVVAVAVAGVLGVVCRPLR